MKKATFTEKIGYGIASLGDSISYNFIGTFFLFFLTTVAGITPAVAGLIIAVGSVWNALFNPIMGYFADNVSTRYGRRRPVIFVSSIFLGIMIFVMFTNIDFSDAFKPVYYGLMTVLFWSSFTGFFVPYNALGTDYASTYDERTSIRSFAFFFNMIGNMFSMMLPTLIVEFLGQYGISTSQAWSATGALLGLVTTITIIITVIVSKDRDLPCPAPSHASSRAASESGAAESDDSKSADKADASGAAAEADAPESKEKFSFLNIFREYISVAKLPPMKYLIVTSLSALILSTMLMSNMLYFLTYNLGMSAGQISFCFFFRSALGIVFIPLTGRLTRVFDKRIALIICYAVGMSGMIVLRFVNLHGFSGALIYMFFLSICTAIYWQIMPSIFYDICAYDKMVTGKKRESMILSFQGLVEALAAGVGGQLLGIILELAGFTGDGSAPTEAALLWIENSATVIPMIFMAVAIFALYMYPLRREKELPLD